MKTNNDMLHGGKLKPEFYQSWANYYTKFIKAYEREGIPIWGITVQNEPMATQTWESCIYSAEDERDFLKNFLGPTMKREGLGRQEDHRLGSQPRPRSTREPAPSWPIPKPRSMCGALASTGTSRGAAASMMFDNVKLVHEILPGQAADLHRGQRRFLQGRRHQRTGDWASTTAAR